MRLHCLALALPVLAGLSPTLGAQAQGDPGVASGRRAPGRAPGSVGVAQRLRLPAGEPAEFQVRVELPDGERVLALERVSFRAPNFRVRAWVESGQLVEVEAGEPTTYLGHVVGDPSASVVASLTPRGLAARVDAGAGGVWRIEPQAAAGPRWHAVSPEEPGDLDLRTCGADDLQQVASPPLPGRHLLDDPIPLDCLKLAEIAFDADFEFYQAYGSSVANTVARIEEILAQVNFYYARDVKIVHQLTEIVVRTAPFYTPTSGGDLLDQFRNRWNNTMQDVPRDITHLMTGKPGSLIEFGGLAFVGVVCTNSQYGWSMDGANIVGHEVGHNWGAPHCLDLSPCNNMCGACFLILPNTKEVIEAHRDSRGCLDDALPFFRPVPPYAMPELVRMDKDDFQASGPIELDVLANDHDGNCQPFSIVAFDASSLRGGSVTLQPAGSLVDRARLIYTPPLEIFVGEDSFEYTLEDSSGQRTVARQGIEVSPVTLHSYWPFDEASGDTAADATGHGHDAVGQVPGQWTTGVLGGALEFDGSQVLDTGDPSFPRPWTVAVWARRRAGAGAGSAILEASNGDVRIKQAPSGVEEVGVSRNGQGNSVFDYVAPIDAWVHLTFVGNSDGTTLYVNGQYQDNVPALIRAPTGTIGSSQQPLHATLDDLRVYDFDLSAAQIAQLHASGGRAEAPVPPDGGGLAFPALGLSWVGAPGVASHDVYLGTSYVAVRDATPVSPEYQGNVGTAAFSPGVLPAGLPAYWRADEVGATTIAGDVWQFTPVEWEHWRLDESSGTVALNSEGGVDGTYGGGALLGQPGASAVLGTSIALDGVNDHVLLPALDLDANTLTVTCWIRRNGPQLDWAGLVFSRAGNTTAGLNFGTDEELRYHWNGSEWGWNSGLVVPDGQWVFVALVVQPDQATIYLGQAGNLTSATNAVGHGVEEFDGALYFGRDDGFSNRDFKGWLDDVRFYRAALTPAEIQTLYALSQ